MSSYPGRTTEESVRIKLDSYLLNPDHPVGGIKAKWYAQALGFTRGNMEDLAAQIVFDAALAVPTVNNEYGQKYVQPTPITGANGKLIVVDVIWITNLDGVTRLVTAPPPKR